MTWLLRLILRPFRALGRGLMRVARKLFFVLNVAVFFTVAMIVLDAILNRDDNRTGEADD